MELKLLFIPLLLLLGLFFNPSFAQINSTTINTTSQDHQPAIQINADTEGKLQQVTIPSEQLLFNLVPSFDNRGNLKNFAITLNPDLEAFYKQVSPRSDLKTVFVYPIFTQAAYSKNGFYDYYRGKCDTKCLTVNIPQPAGYYSSSGEGALILHLLGYPFVTDADVDQNPDILKQYDRVIMLHNEYVTKKEFDAITSHPDVLFLYPNALYAEVHADYASNTITLVRGHGYPDDSIKNGFGWKSDNSNYEYNVFCTQWTIYRSKEGYSMMNCYPEYTLLTSKEMLTLLQAADPTQLLEDTSNWLRYFNSDSAHDMLADYDINGTFVPQWVTKPAIMVENGEITKTEFLNMLDYLNVNHIIR